MGRGGTAEGPWKEVEVRQVQGAAWGAHSEDKEHLKEEVHREENEEGTSFLEVEEPTLEGKRVKFTVDVQGYDDARCEDGCDCLLGLIGGPPGPLGGKKSGGGGP